jgi:tRNA A22 N-methylase
MTPAQRAGNRNQYQKLIDIEEDRYVPKKNLRTGRTMYPSKMPWMLKHWKEGLRQLEEVMKALGELPAENQQQTNSFKSEIKNRQS